MSAEDSVRQALIEFTRAFERGDIDALHGMFANDEALQFYGTHDKLHFTSWSAVMDSFKKQIAVLTDLRCRITGETQVRLLAGGAAACAATSAFAMHAMFGDVRCDFPALRLTCTMERDGERWLFVQMHLSVSDTAFLEKAQHVIAEHL